MPIDLLAVIIGFALLFWGAKRFVAGATALALNLGVSPMLIGLTVVGLGTSAPEILVSLTAAMQHKPGLAIGNALGSNITNIALILGCTAIIVPMKVKSETLRREYPILLAVCLLALLLLLDRQLTRLDGIVLLTGLAVVFSWMIRLGRQSPASDPLALELKQAIAGSPGTARATLLFTSGLILLLASSRLLVWGAVNLAVSFGISDLVIGLTIVAIGTSLPELAASFVSVLQHKHDLAIGNVIGSNMYNLLAVLPMPGLLAPGPFADEILTRDLPIMIGLTLALFAMGYGFGREGRINRFEGLLLLLAFVSYQFLLFLNSSQTVVAIDSVSQISILERLAV